MPLLEAFSVVMRWRDDGTSGPLLDALREQTREHAVREPTPSAACIDSQSVKTAEIRGIERAYVDGKKVKGRKRHLLVDTLGLLMALLITSGGLDEGLEAPKPLDQLDAKDVRRLETIFAEYKNHHHMLRSWMAEHSLVWRSEEQTRPEGSKGCTPLEKRWVWSGPPPGMVAIGGTAKTMNGNLGPVPP